jgi:hypothetical protein
MMNAAEFQVGVLMMAFFACVCFAAFCLLCSSLGYFCFIAHNLIVAMLITFSALAQINVAVGSLVWNLAT